MIDIFFIIIGILTLFIAVMTIFLLLNNLIKQKMEYKEDDIVVITDISKDNGSKKAKLNNDIICKIKNNQNKDTFYLYESNNYIVNANIFRLADPLEIKAYNEGVRDIKNISKESHSDQLIDKMNDEFVEYHECIKTCTGAVKGTIYKTYKDNANKYFSYRWYTTDGSGSNGYATLKGFYEFFQVTTKQAFDQQQLQLLQTGEIKMTDYIAGIDPINKTEVKETKPQFIVGKWYKFKANSVINIAKIAEVTSGNLGASDWIYLGRNIGDGAWNPSYCTEIELLTDLSEIQQYLSEGHIDKIVTKLSKDELFEKAKSDYPIGTKFIAADDNKSQYEVASFDSCQSNLWISEDYIICSLKDIKGYGGYLYYKGKWAEIISKPETKSETMEKPESWCVVCTEDNREAIKDWYYGVKPSIGSGFIPFIGHVYGIINDTCGLTPFNPEHNGEKGIYFDKIISTEEFYTKIGYKPQTKLNETKEKPMETIWLRRTNTEFLADYKNSGSDRKRFLVAWEVDKNNPYNNMFSQINSLGEQTYNRETSAKLKTTLVQCTESEAKTYYLDLIDEPKVINSFKYDSVCIILKSIEQYDAAIKYFKSLNFNTNPHYNYNNTNYKEERVLYIDYVGKSCYILNHSSSGYSNHISFESLGLFVHHEKSTNTSPSEITWEELLRSDGRMVNYQNVHDGLSGVGELRVEGSRLYLLANDNNFKGTRPDNIKNYKSYWNIVNYSFKNSGYKECIKSFASGSTKSFEVTIDYDLKYPSESSSMSNNPNAVEHQSPIVFKTKKKHKLITVNQ
jgi:hypothetical protein